MHFVSTGNRMISIFLLLGGLGPGVYFIPSGWATNIARCNALAWMNAVLDLKLVGWEEDLNGQFLSIVNKCCIYIDYLLYCKSWYLMIILWCHSYIDKFLLSFVISPHHQSQETPTVREAPRLWRRNVLACGVGIWLIRCMDETSQELHTEGHGCAQCMQLERVAFYLKMCFKKCSEHAVFCTFWLENVLLATAACNLSTSELQKVVRDRHFFTILTWKCSSRHSGVQFFYISTSKSVPNM